MSTDLIVDDIRIDRSLVAGTTGQIEAFIENIGNTYHFGSIGVTYRVNGVEVGTDTLGAGLAPGLRNNEDTFFTVPTGRFSVSVTVTDQGTVTETNTGNNTRTEYYTATAPDTIVRDVDMVGLAQDGSVVRIDATVENIGTADQDPFTLQYWVHDSTGSRQVGTSSLLFGLEAGADNLESDLFTADVTGPHRVEVRVINTQNESNTGNNSRSEYFGQRHTEVKTLANSAEEVRLAAFMAHTVYGDDRVPDSWNGNNDDNGRDDNYRSFLSQNGLTLLDAGDLVGDFEASSISRWQTGGLYEGRSSAISPFWEGQALLARETLENGDTALVLGFRGTDEADGPLALVGQAYTGNGLYDHYTSLRPLVEAMIDYANDSANSIEAVIVGGHSLGGAMVDMFSTIDAQRLKSSIDLTTVSIGSPGVNLEAYVDSTLGSTDPLFFKQFRSEYDVGVLNVSAGLVATGLNTPNHHITLSHTEDRVTFEDYSPFAADMVTSVTLNNNTNFGRFVGLDLVNVDNRDRSGDLGFGAEHNDGMYWAHIGAMTDDPLVGFYSGQTVRLGRADYAEVDDYAGGDLGVFPTAATGSDNDTGSAAISGTSGRDWLLGLSGNDQLYGGSGDDLLSGGEGADYLNGGSGNDRMAGGLGNDFYIVGAAGDQIVGEIAFSQGGGVDTVRTYVQNYVQPDNIELVRLATETSNLDLNATGNDAPGTMVGSAGDNLLVARGGNDQVNGNGGDDTLIGNTGRDTLVGGAGADRFIYASISESRVGSAERDVINGVDRGADLIDLSAMDADLTRFGDQAFDFIGSARFSGAAGELRLQSLGGPNAVLVEGDLRGDGVADFQLFVNLTRVLSADDFIL